MMRRRSARLGEILARDARHVCTEQIFQPGNPAAAIAAVGEERTLFCARECYEERVHLLRSVRGHPTKTRMTALTSDRSTGPRRSWRGKLTGRFRGDVPRKRPFTWSIYA